MDYLFVFKNGGWWLKIDTVEKLTDYLEITDSRFGQAFNSLIHSKEFGMGMEHADETAFAIGMYGQNRKLSPLSATIDFRNRIIQNQYDAVLTHGCIYIKQNGGYHWPSTKDEKSEAFVRKTVLIFPDFKEDEIRVKRFPGGEHFYAYIGNMEVRDGDTIKWNTYEEAYNQAKRLIGSEE